MAPSLDNLDALADELSCLSMKDAQLEAIAHFMHSASYHEQEIGQVHSSGTSIGLQDTNYVRAAARERTMQSLLGKHGIEMSDVLAHMAKGGGLSAMKVRLDTIPCAHVDANRTWSCSNAGTQTCAVCRLVKYCSKDCQRAHWRTHKADCKDPICSENWQPAWVEEHRSPQFMRSASGTQNTNWRAANHPVAYGISLWGNMPAINVLNINENELKETNSLSIAFIASGDLRNVITTVNSIPADHSGRVEVVLNDHAPYVVLRNIVLLSILGNVPTVEFGTDIALHLWYSAFLPEAYNLVASTHAMQLIEAHASGKPFSGQLGPNASMTGILNDEHIQLLAATVASTYSVMDANTEVHRVHTVPERRDSWHRRLCGVEPTHRLALQEYRRFGLVYPFGAANWLFNQPNRFLFSPDGRWLQSDHADPLESWDIQVVLKAGERHGALRGDLYACLYFYLTEQLQAFAKRLRTFDITFRITCMDGTEQAKDIRSGTLSDVISPNIRFDRIDVSNTFDIEYMGISNILSHWSPLLKPANESAIIGYFMNWVPKQPGSTGTRCDERTVSRLMKEIRRDGRWDQPKGSGNRTGDHMSLLGQMGNLTAYLDNSAAFEEYLNKQGMDEHLRKCGLKRRPVHRITPPRIGVAISSLWTALPTFVNEDAWYLYANLSQNTWSERFVEIVRK